MNAAHILNFFSSSVQLVIQSIDFLLRYTKLSDSNLQIGILGLHSIYLIIFVRKQSIKHLDLLLQMSDIRFQALALSRLLLERSGLLSERHNLLFIRIRLPALAFYLRNKTRNLILESLSISRESFVFRFLLVTSAPLLVKFCLERMQLTRQHFNLLPELRINRF